MVICIYFYIYLYINYIYIYIFTYVYIYIFIYNIYVYIYIHIYCIIVLCIYLYIYLYINWIYIYMISARVCVCTVLKTVFVSRVPNKKQKGPNKSLKTHWCTKTSFRGRIHVAIRARCWICHPAMVVLIGIKRKKCPGSCNVTVTRSSPKSIKIWPWFFTEAANQQL